MERLDALAARLPKLKRRTDAALSLMDDFLSKGDAYVGVSWGKDSTVIAHLAATLKTNALVAWFPAGRIENPDNALVRDSFLERFGSAIDYIEVEAGLDSDDWDRVEGHDGAQRAFEAATREVGARYVSGVRAEESGIRKMAMRSHGLSTPRTCRPIGWWSAAEVFAYLYRHDLPVHPAYAMTMGGTLDRSRIRVSTLGGWRGRNRGRREWENHYYGDVLSAIENPGT